MSPAEARERRFSEAAARRNTEAACALDFLVYGDDEEHGRHAERCIFGSRLACSRNYDPQPYVEATPSDTLMYEGTSIGALYAISPWLPSMTRALAGWNVR